VAAATIGGRYKMQIAVLHTAPAHIATGARAGLITSWPAAHRNCREHPGGNSGLAPV